MSALEWLAAAALMTALFWMTYILERMVSLGVLGALRPVDPEDELRQALWARRAKRGHYNAVENLVVFATLVLVAFAMGKGDEPGILAATQVYFWARLIHFPAITFGLPGIRTVAYLVGFGAQIAVALRIFT
ncbi:MAG: MAPEG family protein [Myxococcales bacterium]|nr:MAPEG family protein [Myxococcales bacterium]